MTSVPTFATRPTFLGLERSNADATICVAGIPFDLGTSNRPGARFGPAAIRQASRMLVDGDHPASWAEIEKIDLADIGDFRIAHGDIEGSLAKIEEQAAVFRHLVALGGDHTITLASLRALARRKGPVGLVHFDGHVDTWPESFGLVFGHGSPFYHAIEEGLTDPAPHDPDRHPLAAAPRHLRLDRRQGGHDRLCRGGARNRPASGCRTDPGGCRDRAGISKLLTSTRSTPLSRREPAHPK